MNPSKRIFPVSLFLFCILFSISQQHSPGYAELLNQYRQADIFYEEATALADSPDYSEDKERNLNQQAVTRYKKILQSLSSSPAFDSLKYWTSFKVGELHHYFEQLDDALSGYHTAIHSVKKGKLPDSLLFKPYLYSGILFYNKNQYDSASLYFEQAEKILANHNYNLEESERLHNTFGVLYYEKGDYRQAKNYFQKALQLLSPTHPYYKALRVNYQVNLAQLHFKMEDYEAANRIYQSLLSQDVSTHEINHNLGLINLYLGAPGKAVDYFRKVQYSSNRIIFLYANTGQAFMNLEQPDSAQKYLDSAIAVSQRYGASTDHIALGLALKNYGDLFMQKKEPSRSLTYYHQALHQFYPAYRDTAITSNPVEFTGLFSYINLFNALVAKAEAWHQLYLISKDQHFAKEELKTYESVFKLVGYVERTYESDEARLFLDKSKYTIHSKPIDIAYELYLKSGEKIYIEKLYNFDQQNKASILAVRLHAAQIPSKDASMVAKEKYIKGEISRLSLKAAQLNDSAEEIAISQQIRDHEIELGRIQETISDNSGYYEQIPSIEYLQKKFLQKGTGLVSYHLSPGKLTTLMITKDLVACRQKTLPSNFLESVEEVINQLKDANSHPATAALYQVLFDSLDLNGIERLIIIPDDELNYLSFESLEDINQNFLIEKFAIQYQYTTALLRKEKTYFSRHETLALAPFAGLSYQDDGKIMQPLPHSKTEVDNIKGIVFIDSAATKEKLVGNIGRYKVVHLATHAIVNNEKDKLSYILFAQGHKENDHLLYAEEIYNLPLQQTSLVILSACETGSGALVKGEGVMSLSRAFTYAGCPNIITSFWVANDRSTAYIADKLHYYLNRNEPVDQALQKAKLDFLSDKSINPRMKHPYYWSHLVFVGNYGVTSGNNWWEWVLAGLVILLIGMVLIKMFRTKRNRRFIGEAGS